MKPKQIDTLGLTDITAVRRILQGHEGRERQLRSLVVTILLTVSAGFAVLVLATVVREVERLASHLPTLVIGLAVLIALLANYILFQHRTLNRTRAALMEQVIRVEQAVGESFVDALTGLFNRKYMDYLVNYEANRVNRYGGGFALLMVDVDGFKQINDSHGHLEGDRFLQEVTVVLKKTFRDSDTIMRYGGDEFLVLMPDTPRQHLERVVERVREEVSAWNREARPIHHTMSLSFGVACFGQGDRVDEVMAAADRRMYDHKRRNHAGAEVVCT